MYGLLFLLVTEWIMRKATKGKENIIRWKINSKLEDLDFAEDIALITSSYQQMQEKTNQVETYASKAGLKRNEKKTKMMRRNKKKRKITVSGKETDDAEEFIYHGAMANKAGGTDEDVATT